MVSTFIGARIGMSSLNKQEGGDHYKKLKIQPVEYIHANNIPFIEGCIIKYATRWKDKNGVEDLKKIIHFAELLIELENTPAKMDEFFCFSCTAKWMQPKDAQTEWIVCPSCGGDSIRKL